MALRRVGGALLAGGWSSGRGCTGVSPAWLPPPPLAVEVLRERLEAWDGQGLAAERAFLAWLGEGVVTEKRRVQHAALLGAPDALRGVAEAAAAAPGGRGLAALGPPQESGKGGSGALAGPVLEVLRERARGGAAPPREVIAVRHTVLSTFVVQGGLLVADVLFRSRERASAAETPTWHESVWTLAAEIMSIGEFHSYFMALTKARDEGRDMEDVDVPFTWKVVDINYSVAGFPPPHIAALLDEAGENLRPGRPMFTEQQRRAFQLFVGSVSVSLTLSLVARMLG